ncbi:MAG: hypothetical protein K8W52_39155 [Deltaproteobacteria bacterium]|nr:hypothetical protein [Deltaproteobacteria bacterium]
MRPLLAALLFVAACGDNLAPPGPLDQDIAARLARLPGVSVTEIAPDPQAPVGYRYFDLWFTQPIDHDDPGAGSYQQYAALIHRGDDAPLVVYTSGYDAGRLRTPVEPTQLVDGTQLSIEYRFYGNSHPDVVDWTKLDLDQAMADNHAIVEDLATIYPGVPRLATGASKGGETALEHAFLYPADFDGVVAYVAPLITDLPDQRYATVTDDVGTAPCRTRVRALAREMLVRRAAMESRAAAADTFAIVGVPKAVETAIVEFEFSFWMTRGIGACSQLPDPAAVDDDTLYYWLDYASSPSGYADTATRTSGQQYTLQFENQLGYPVWQHANLDDLMLFAYEDWSPFLPPGAQVHYDPTMVRAQAAWAEHASEHVLFIDGEWDPWGPGYPQVAPGRDAFRLVVPQGSHWSTGIYSLTPTDQAIALDALARWVGGPRARVVPAPLPLPQRATWRMP